ncbi:MAG: glycosyltransferase family 2 protein [Hyphomicrobiales bacterium]|nr:glycosyltransferase family 2 protein [Hyphomicrobiales bacterium]
MVIPTFNEAENVPRLIEKLRTLLAGRRWEAIFVDDNSRDDTAGVVRRIGERDQRIRCIRRIGRRGLAGACVEGMLATQARAIAVMDADLQHDESLLLAMLQRLQQGDIDLVVASRYLAEGSAAGLDTMRSRLSRLANRIARMAGVALSDPMSGYFMIRREAFERVAPSLATDGFKILFDIVASARGTLRIAELPYVFRARSHGESKLDARVAIDYLALVVSKLSGDRVSFRFLLFCLVGLSGVVIHMAILQAALSLGSMNFPIAQTVATVGAIAWNFAFNNMLTYCDQRLAGWRFVTGLARFQIVCGIGAVSNVGIASLLYGHDTGWWLAGLTGALMGAVWNYMASAAWVWRTR